MDPASWHGLLSSTYCSCRTAIRHIEFCLYTVSKIDIQSIYQFNLISKVVSIISYYSVLTKRRSETIPFWRDKPSMKIITQISKLNARIKTLWNTVLCYSFNFLTSGPHSKLFGFNLAQNLYKHLVFYQFRSHLNHSEVREKKKKTTTFLLHYYKC